MAKVEPKLVKLGGFLGIGVIVALGGLLVGQPLVSQLQGQNAAVTAAQEANQSASAQLAELQKAQANQSAVDALNAELIQQFPEFAQVPELLDNVSNSALAAGIAAGDITKVDFGVPSLVLPDGQTAPAAPAEGEAPAEAASKLAVMTVDLVVEGDARQFETFLGGLASMDRGFTVTKFGLDLGEDGNGSMTLSGNTFLYDHIETPEELQQPAAPEAPVEEEATVEP